MKRLLIFLTALSALCTLPAQEIQHYTLQVGDFSRLSVNSSINVEYRCSSDSAGFAVFETNKLTADKILFGNNNSGHLTIEYEFLMDSVEITDVPTIVVYSKFLSDVKNCGDSTVRVISPKPVIDFKAVVIGNGRLIVRNVECNKFSASIQTGNGTIVASGKCDDVVLSNTGVGAIQADNLQAVNGSCRFFGTGTTGCWVTGVLSIKGMFPGKLYFRGEPERIRNYSMGVKIYNIDGEEWKG